MIDDTIATLARVQQDIGVYGADGFDADAARAHALLDEACERLARSDFRARVSAALIDAGLEPNEREILAPGQFAWWRSGGHDGDRYLSLSVQPRDGDERIRAAHALVGMLDGYDCDDLQPAGVDWDAEPYTACGGVCLRAVRQ